jgi:hypothetical protein
VNTFTCATVLKTLCAGQELDLNSGVTECLIKGVNGRIILKWIFETLGVGGAEWIDLAQDRDRWRALVYTVMNLRVP